MQFISSFSTQRLSNLKLNLYILALRCEVSIRPVDLVFGSSGRHIDIEIDG